MTTAPPPIESEPRRVRPPYDVPDRRLDHLMTTDPEAWRRAVQLDRVAALLEPLAGLDLSEREHAIVEWLAGWDLHMIAPVVRMLYATRAAGPLDGLTTRGVVEYPCECDIRTPGECRWCRERETGR